MSLISNRISRKKLQLGDHIYSYRSAHAYSHHGIYVEEDRVIHFTRNSSIAPPESSTKSKSKSRKGKRRTGKCDNCGHDPSTCPGGVLKTCLDCFLKGHGLLLFQYGVSPQHYDFKLHKGSCSTEACDPADVTVKRATEAFNQGKDSFGEYHLLNNNCETFAAYCKLGKRVSQQALEVISMTNKMSTAAIVSGSTASMPFAPPSLYKQAAYFLVPKVVTYITSKASSSSSSR